MDDCERLDRREFLRALAMISASVAAPQVFAGTSDRPLILGSGEHRYEWIRGWGKLPADKTYGSMHGDVVVDAQNHVYFSTDGE